MALGKLISKIQISYFGIITSETVVMHVYVSQNISLICIYTVNNFLFMVNLKGQKIKKNLISELKEMIKI